MVYLSLQQQFFREIHMSINVGDKQQINADSTFTFNVNYNEDCSLCTAILIQELKEKSNEAIFIVMVEGIGNFKCEGIADDEDKKIAHIQAYTLLFPYIQNMISRLVVNAGLPPLMIESAKMTLENVEVENTK